MQSYRRNSLAVLRQIFMPIFSCCTKRHFYADLALLYSKALLYAIISSIKFLLIILYLCLFKRGNFMLDK